MINRFLFRSVDAASLAVFRILFGAIMLFESVNYGVFLCLDCLYRNTSMLFKYHHFEWVSMPPGQGLEWLFLVMGVAALFVMLGLFYRWAAVVLVITFCWHFLLDQALYLNHYYLVILFASIMVFVPANRYWSLDAIRKPAMASNRVPFWTYFWLGAQLEIVLIYAGFVKLNSDWLQLEPMRLWMNNASRDEAQIFQWLTMDWGIAFASYGVIALHLIGAPLLLWRRTRLLVLCCYALFHVCNMFVFNIGIFPWLTLAATLLLFDPEWPRQFLRCLSSRVKVQFVKRLAVRLAQPVNESFVTSAELAQSDKSTLGTAAASDAVSRQSWQMRAFIVSLIAVWSIVQIAVPLRHFVRPGNVAWNEDGHRFSWRMKLRSKRGSAKFYLRSDDGQVLETINPDRYLNAKQVRKMTCIPDLLWQFAQFLEDEYNQGGTKEIQVYVDTACSLNTRKAQPLVNRLVDLTSIERDAPSSDWLTSLKYGLPRTIF